MSAKDTNMPYLGEEGLRRITHLASAANEQGFVLSDRVLETFYWADVFDRVFTSMWGHRYADQNKNIVLYLHYLIDGMIASGSIAVPILDAYGAIPRDHLSLKRMFTTQIAEIQSVFDIPKPCIPPFLLTGVSLNI